MTMDEIADFLSGAGDWSNRPVVDATGLKGTYDFVIEFAPAYVRQPKPDEPNALSGPDLSEAIEEQLGLRLHKEEGNATFFKIDRIEYPSPD